MAEKIIYAISDSLGETAEAVARATVTSGVHVSACT